MAFPKEPTGSVEDLLAGFSADPFFRQSKRCDLIDCYPGTLFRFPLRTVEQVHRLGLSPGEALCFSSIRPRVREDVVNNVHVLM